MLLIAFALPQDLCAAHPDCNVFTWHDLTYPLPWNGTCWFLNNQTYTYDPEEHHWSGCKLNKVCACAL